MENFEKFYFRHFFKIDISKLKNFSLFDLSDFVNKNNFFEKLFFDIKIKIKKKIVTGVTYEAPL